MQGGEEIHIKKNAFHPLLKNGTNREKPLSFSKRVVVG
jgi:hypothetical protein